MVRTSVNSVFRKPLFKFCSRHPDLFLALTGCDSESEHKQADQQSYCHFHSGFLNFPSENIVYDPLHTDESSDEYPAVGVVNGCYHPYKHLRPKLSLFRQRIQTGFHWQTSIFPRYRWMFLYFCQPFGKSPIAIVDIRI